MAELTEEAVYNNDLDPMEAIRALREEEQATETTEDVVDVENETTEEEQASEETIEETADDEQESTEEEGGEEEKEDVEKSTTKKFKANGQDFEFTSEEMEDQFETVFGKAMDYTQKMQKIAPYRKMISALEEENISQEDFNKALDLLKGNKEALKDVIKENDIDTFDLDFDEDSKPYVPTEYGRDESQMAIEEVTSRISGDEEYGLTVDIVDSQWDSESRIALGNNPNMIEGLHNDVKSGIYDKVAPLAMKMKVLDGGTKSSLEYYLEAGQQLQKSSESNEFVDKSNTEASQAKSQADKASSEASKKRAASSTKSRAGKGVVDYLDDNDEDFDAWYKKINDEN